MPLSSVLLSGVLFFAQPSSQPATEPTTMPSAEVAALVATLTGEDASAREEAQSKLLEVGEDALPALDAARKSVRDPDVQVRLDTLLVQIRERADIGASRVTLKFEDAPIDQVLASLGRQARTDFGGDLTNDLGNGRADNMPRVTLDLQNVTFWKALQDIQDAANVVFYPQPEGWRVTRNFGQPGTVRGTESGAFLIQPMSASYQRTISYARNMGVDGENFSIQFQALAEPKIKLSGGMGVMNVERAVDSNGNDLLAQQRAQQINTNGQNSIMSVLQLKYPKNAGTTIAEIRGTMKLSIARRTQQIASDDLMGGGKITSSIDGAKVRIDPAPEDAPANGVGFIVTIEGNGDAALIQRVQQNVQQMIRVTDSRDVVLRMSNFNITRSDQRGIIMRLAYMPMQPQASKGPHKLRIEVPTSFREIEVPFVMKDLRMP